MQQIKDALASALEKEGISSPFVPLELTNDLTHGDYASSAAMHYAKELKTNPRSLAEKLIASMGSIEGVSNIDIAGPGFINFRLDSVYLHQMLDEGRAKDDEWGGNAHLKNKKIMVEYTDPNPFKEFHIGHLMSNAIGESIARALLFSGAEVKRANYQGDVGLHVAKAIYAYSEYEPSVENEVVKWGLAYKMGNDLYENNEEAKYKIDAINKKIYEHDPEVISLYEAGRKVSLDYFETIYGKLGMEPRQNHGETSFFDYYFYESTCWEIGKRIVQKNTPTVFQNSEGAYVFRGEQVDSSLHTRVFITSKGLPTYEAKELGLLKLKDTKKEQWNFDESITVTANEQKEYFRVVLAAAKQINELGQIAGHTKHVVHGMMRFAEGKMSSRKGNVITGLFFLQELFEVAKERAKQSRAEDQESLAHQVALAAAKYQILRQASGKDIIFNRERALAVDGDSGPYLQYTHARTSAIVEKAKESGVQSAFDSSAAASELARLVYRFGEIVQRAQEELEPHHIANYLIAVASAFNRWYANEHILDGTSAAAHKVALTDITRLTLKNGLWLLGIPAPERM